MAPEGRPRGPEDTDRAPQVEGVDTSHEVQRTSKIGRWVRGAALATAMGLGLGAAACEDPQKDNSGEVQQDPEYAKYQPLEFIYLFPHAEGFNAQYLNRTEAPVHVAVSYEDGTLLSEFDAATSDGDNPRSFILPVPEEGTKVLYVSVDGNEAIEYSVPNVPR